MKKIINDPNTVATELLDGLVDYYNGDARLEAPGVIVMNDIPDNKVALLVAGGSGHEPIYHGLVGKNFADGAACGDIFAAPPPNVMLDATRAVNKGNGVLYLYGQLRGGCDEFQYRLSSWPRPKASRSKPF